MFWQRESKDAQIDSACWSAKICPAYQAKHVNPEEQPPLLQIIRTNAPTSNSLTVACCPKVILAAIFHDYH